MSIVRANQRGNNSAISINVRASFPNNTRANHPLQTVPIAKTSKYVQYNKKIQPLAARHSFRSMMLGSSRFHPASGIPK